MKKLYFLLFTFLIGFGSFAQTAGVDVFINEIHYDDASGDSGEGIEVAGPAGTDLSGFTLTAYNGNGGGSYDTTALSGSIPDEGAGYGTLFFAISGLQNGAPDGIALDDGGNVQFLSYEGSFMAIDGPANAMNSTDIGVSEGGTVEGQSLQLTGTGFVYSNFTWASESTSSYGSINVGQNFSTPSPAITITSPADMSVLSSGTTSVDIEFSTTNLVGGEQVDITVTKNGGSPTTTNNVLSSPFTINSTSDGDDYIVTAELVDGSVIDFETINFRIQYAPQPLPVSEDFTYADGSLVSFGGWTNHGGANGDILVSSGQAVLKMGDGNSEDAYLEFIPQLGSIYYAFDFSVDDLGAPYTGTDNEYFAHFKTSAFDYSARFDVVEPSGGGDFSVGISSDQGTADITWATDLAFGVTYRVTVKYNQDTNQAQLWIDAAAEGDTSVLGDDQADPGDSVSQFAFRQATSAETETIRVDNLRIGTTFGSVTLGSDDLILDNFKLYPNPTSTGKVTISSRSSSVISAQVFDILGKQVMQAEVSNNELNVSTLRTGLYILKLTQNESITTKKLVIK